MEQSYDNNNEVMSHFAIMSFLISMYSLCLEMEDCQEHSVVKLLLNSMVAPLF